MNILTDQTNSAVRSLSLALARCGQRLRIVGLAGNSPESVRLRELGFCELAEVRKISDGSALICNLLGSRVAIARDLGLNIFVKSLLH